VRLLDDSWARLTLGNELGHASHSASCPVANCSGHLDTLVAASRTKFGANQLAVMVSEPSAFIDIALGAYLGWY
jgi:hypothetical protein